MLYLFLCSLETVCKLRSFIQFLFQVRHPNILSFLHSTETEVFDGPTPKLTIYVVTEPVTPLSEKIKELGLEGTQRYNNLLFLNVIVVNGIPCATIWIITSARHSSSNIILNIGCADIFLTLKLTSKLICSWHLDEYYILFLTE